jgi:signal transduction histidine kinase
MFRHPRLALLATAEWPAWLWSADGSRILWANAAGAAAFGAANSSACSGRRFAMTELPPAQVLRLAATLPSGGQERLERLRGFGGKLGRTLTCACSRIIADGGRGAVLVVATEPAGPALTLAERVRLLLEDGDAAAAFMPDGRLLYANAKAQPWLNGAGTLAALAIETLAAAALQNGTAKGAATFNGEACDVLMACLGQGATSVLLVVPGTPAAQGSEARVSAIELQTRPAKPVASTKVSADAGAAAGAKAAPPIGPPLERRHPLRFVWEMDADGRFTVASDEFVQLLGSRAAMLGRLWPDIAAELKLDPRDQINDAVASRETWSGITVSWPIAPPGLDRRSELRLPVELSGLPVFDRDRNFRGYRGFGVCRDLAQVTGLAHSAPAETATLAAPLPAASRHDNTAAAASEQIAAPAGGDPAPANVVPFRPAAADPKAAPSLTPVERRAFRELAQELTSRLHGTQVTATAEALAQELAGQNRALSQDELRQVLSRALNRENDEQFGQEASQDGTQHLAQGVSVERSEVDEQANEEPDRIENQEQPQEPVSEERADTRSSETASERPNEDGNEEADPSAASLQQPLIEPALLDRIPLGILIYRHDALLYANRQFLDLSGYADVAAIEAAGGLNRLFAGPADAALADSSAAQGSAQTLAILARSGERVPLEGRMITVLWNTSPALALFIKKQESDATTTAPAKRNDAEIGAAQRDGEAQAMAAAKAEFVARISHDIRNPLNAITGFAEAIMNERFGPIGNERYREYIKDLHAAAAHLSSTVDDLLDLSKLESGRIALTFASVNLNELIQQCVGMMQPQANRARIIIRSALTSGLPLVKADERALRQIVLNLLSNSIKCTGPGGQIIVSTVFSDRREAILRVRDTGVGMSERQIAAALAPAADINAWTSSGSGGTELDLPLTKTLAEANHAQFRIKSAPEAGTLVEIAFAPNRTLAA